MKKRILIFLLLLALVLAGCTRAETVYTVEEDGKTFTVDTEKQTIICDGFSYRYERTKSGRSTEYTIIYPDGATYTATWTKNAGSSTGGGGGDAKYNSRDRVSGTTMTNILHAHEPKGINPAKFGTGILFLIQGIFSVMLPEISRYIWMLRTSRRRRHEYPEPTDQDLLVTRLEGVVLVIVGIALIVTA